MRFICALVAGSLMMTSPAVTQERPSPADIFDRFEADCSRDDGSLWGISLCGPFLLVEQESGMVYANQPDPEGLLQQTGDLWTAAPDENSMPPYADTAASWSGADWAIARYVSDSSADGFARTALHESFHRIQSDLPFSPAGTDIAPHLDELQGRLWLQLGLRAAEDALETDDPELFQQHFRDAVLFTLWRHHLFDEAVETERAMELHERLAEYTGWRLAGESDAALAANLAKQQNMDSYARSFPYATGPAWGYMLDKAGIEWRSHLAKDGPGPAEIASDALAMELPSEEMVIAAAGKYDYTSLLAAETLRAERIAALKAEYMARFVSGPRLIAPLTYISFDPRTVTALGEAGQVYGILKDHGPWGTLETESGALVIWSSREVVVDRLDGTVTDGLWETDQWRLELNDGWMLEERGSDLYVVEQ